MWVHKKPHLNELHQPTVALVKCRLGCRKQLLHRRVVKDVSNVLDLVSHVRLARLRQHL
jgi:hypothetical protein